jgi:signal transduction histidine kinase/DNA-binding response OmpR family regulator/ligand-binding sensor domain-containing protein
MVAAGGVAQSVALNFAHFSVNDGLSSSAVLDIYQDRSGLMWFGTDDGLNRFDGYSFRQFPEIREALSNYSVRDIHEDPAGRIWIAAFQGAGYLERDQGGGYSYHPVIQALNCSVISPLKGGRLLIGTSGGLRLVNPATGAVSFITTDHGLPSNRIMAIQTDDRNRHWILFPEGPARFNPRTKRVESFHPIRSDTATTPEDWKSLTVAGDRLWLVSDRRLIRYDPVRQKVDRRVTIAADSESGTSNETYFVAATQNHGIWIGTDRGLLIYDPERHTLRRHLKGQDQHGINNNELHCFYDDRQGNIWLGTYGGGVNLHSAYNTNFDRFNFELNETAAGQDNIVSDFAEDGRGHLWITTWGDGLKYYDRASKRHRVFHFKSGRFTREVFRSVAVGRDTQLWLATDHNGLIRLDPTTGEYRHWRKESSSLASDNLYCVHEGLGRVWIGLGGGSEGLQTYARRSDRFETLPVRSPRTGQSAKYVRTISDDGERHLFLGTHGQGLWVYDVTDRSVRQYAGPGDGGPLSGGIVYSQHYDPRGYLWVGTMAGGLNLLHLNSGRVVRIGRAHGLPDDCINGILADDEGDLWMSTNRGLVKFSPPPFLFSDTVTVDYVDTHLSEDAFVHFVAEDGLQSNEFKYGAYYRGSDGQMYFGGINGYNRFQPGAIVKNPAPPPVVITDIRVFDPTVWPASRSPEVEVSEAGGSPSIELSYNQNLLTIDYAALNYSQSNKNQYAYYLEGFDNDWRYVGNLRTASYTNLPPGEYTFRVKASNNDGVWNESGAALDLVIVPPIWGRTWFQLVVILGLVSVLFCYYRYRLQEEKRKTQALETAVRVRTRELAAANDQLKQQQGEIEQMWGKVHDADQQKLRFFTNISHEFRTPLTLIIGPLEDIIRGSRTAINRMDTLRIVHKNAVRLLRLINELLDLRSIESGGAKLHVQHLNLAQFLRSIAANFRYQTDLKDITLRVDLPEELPLWIDAEKMEKVFFNILGNALKFTKRGGEIVIASETVPESGMVRVTVRNSGKYIPPELLENIFNRYVKSPGASSRGSTGIGLALVKELVEFHYGRVEVSSSPAGGTAFGVLLPLGLAAYDAAEVSERTTFELEETYDLEIGGAGAGASLAGATEPEAGDSEKTVVLIAEDDPDLRLYLRSLFEPDHTVIETNNGRTALELTQKFIPDFVISDLMMPELDGLEFCRRLKSDERTSHIPIIMVTARTFEEDKLKGLQTGVDDYITKPFSSRMLKLKVENILSRRRVMQERLRDISQIYQVNPDNATETSFYKKLIEAIETNLSDENFNTSRLAEAMNMSRSQLYRKIQAVINRPASELIREIRMKHAESKLLHTDEQVSTIAYSLGFKNVSHFTKTFTAKFGMPPTHFRSRHLETN